MSKLPLIDLLLTEDDFHDIKIYHENRPDLLANARRSSIASCFDPATIGYRMYNFGTGESTIFLTDQKDLDTKSITEKYIKMLKETNMYGLCKAGYYKKIAAYILMNHTDKLPDNMVLAQINKFNNIPHDHNGYFMCMILNDIFKHGEIHIDATGDFYWYDTIREQYYDTCGLVKYPPITIPIAELNKDYMDAAKGKKPLTDLNKSYLYNTISDYAKSICELENDKYEGGIMI